MMMRTRILPMSRVHAQASVIRSRARQDLFPTLGYHGKCCSGKLNEKEMYLGEFRWKGDGVLIPLTTNQDAISNFSSANADLEKMIYFLCYTILCLLDTFFT